MNCISFKAEPGVGALRAGLGEQKDAVGKTREATGVVSSAGISRRSGLTSVALVVTSDLACWVGLDLLEVAMLLGVTSVPAC